MYPGKTSGVQPYAGYLFDRSLADGWNFNSITHSFRAGTFYLIGERSSIELGGAYDFIIYPAYGTERTDSQKSLRLGISLPALQDLLVFILAAEYQIRTSPVDDQNFTRWRAGLTTVIHLDI
jgi:hypothetical protein